MEGTVRSASLTFIVLAAGLGCRRDSGDVSVVRVTAPPVQAESGSAFFEAVRSLRERIPSNSSLLRANVFSETQKSKVLLAAPVPLASIAREVSRSSGLTPADSTAPELRLLGKAMRWRIERAITAGNLDLAANEAATGLRFGFSLIRGTPRMHSLGYAIAADMRSAIAPALPQLSPKALRIVASGAKDALAVEWNPESLLREMQTNIASAQDLVVRKDEKGLIKFLGPDAKDFTSALKGLGSPAKEAALFGRLLKQADWEVDRLRTALAMPASARGPFWFPKERTAKQREQWPAPPVEGKFSRFARHLTGYAKSLADMRDEAVARTRLLVLEAEIMRRKKLGQGIPSDLTGFTPPIQVDPYSGEPFVLNSDGVDYQLYSVGRDFSDNGGETNESFDTPDLTVERRR